MLLSCAAIQEGRELGAIVIEPFDPAQLNGSGYNLRLDRVLKVYEKAWALHSYWSDYQFHHHRHPLDALDMKVDEKARAIDIPETGLVLYPGILYLGSTVEYTETHGYEPWVTGRSSVGRLGMTVHVTAGQGDPGFCGTWTLEIVVVHPLRVYAGTQVCQIKYETVLGEPTPYRGKYAGDRGPKTSRLWKDFVKGGDPWSPDSNNSPGRAPP